MITDISKIVGAQTQEVTLPGWDAEPFVAELRRPSLLKMAATGRIPNELMSAAQKLFNEGYDHKSALDTTGTLLMQIAEAALVSPSMAELNAAGIELTDLQLVSIYNFAQTGVRALEPFREIAANSNAN